MKTAQFKHKKEILLTASVLTISALLLGSYAKNTYAQAASNPFVPTPTFAQAEALDLEAPEPTLYDDTNATRTIAQDKVALTAIPPRLGDDGSLTGAPGEKLQVQLRVRNITETTIPVVTSIEDFILDEDGETPISINDNVSNRWSLASWVTATPTEHEIGPKSTEGINVLIEIPEDALPGGHYAMVLHTPGLANPSLDENSGESASAVNQRVGTLLYVVVKGPINEEAYIRDFNIPGFSEYGPVPFDFTIENNSDIHITPQMSVEYYNMFNQKVDTIPVGPKNIFPLSSRDFSGKWDRIWGFGRYTAKLTMSYGSQGSIVVANTNFWLFPVKIVLAAITGLFTVLLIGFAIKRHLNHRKEMDTKRIQELESQIEEMQTQGDEENTV